MVMPPRSCSSGMQSIRRELQRRRPKPLAPKRSAITKQSAPPPPPQLQKYPTSAAAKSPLGSARTHAPRPPLPRTHAPPSPAAISHSTPPPPPPTHSAPSSAGSAIPSILPDDELLRPGTEVGVRTRTTMLKTGKVLVLWLRATIALPTNGGYGVVYDGNWPPIYVPRRHVRKIEPSPTTPPPSLPPSCATSSSAALPATLKKEMRPPPRPTTAGKSLRLIRRSLLPEMEGKKTQAALPGY